MTAASRTDLRRLPQNSNPTIRPQLAVQATKNIETRLQRLPEERTTLPPFEFEDTEENKVTQGLKQQAWFLSHLSLCTPERLVDVDFTIAVDRDPSCECSWPISIPSRFRELSERRTERRRRKTANPHFSSAAVEERRRQETERKKKKTTISDGKNKVIFALLLNAL